MHIQRIFRRFVFIFIFGGVLLYGGFALRNALRGPHVLLTQLPSPVTTAVVTIQGSAVRAETVTINSLPVPLTTEGTFALTTALVPGDNEFIVSASDRFGSTHEERLHVYHVPTDSPPSLEAPQQTDVKLIDNP